MTDQVTPDTDTKEEDVYIFPASFAQKRFWFLDQFEPGSPWYNIPTAFRLRGSFDIHCFKQAVQEIIDRHESLRTTFEAIDGEPMQVVSPQLTLDIPVTDLQHLEPAEQEQRVKELSTTEARKPFDLATGPLMRVSIITCATEDHIVLLSMHHIISDGWSMGVLVGEISSLYNSFLNNEQPQLEELPIQFGDYAEWQTEYLQGEVLEEQLKYWEEEIGSNPPVLELPTDRPRPMVQTNVGATMDMQIPTGLVQQLKDFSRREGGTLFMTLLAAFKVLLARYSGQYDISVGTPIANRTRKETEGLIGLFINTLVLRTRFYDQPGFRELFQRERISTLGAYEHQDIPFEFLVDKLQPDRDMSYPPLFQVMFILQNAPVNITQISSDLRMEMLDVDMGTSTYDLTLALAEGSEGISVSAEYNTDLFEAATIKRMLGHYLQILQAAMRYPDLSVARLPLLNTREQHQIIQEWNATRAERDHSLCIHQLFEQRAADSPDATAVVYLDQSISYGQLEKRANQLAHFLIEAGAGPDITIGIMANKSIDLMVSVLAVLKSGSAYLPLDPGYPEDRLEYMLEDASISILLSQPDLKDNLKHFSGRLIIPAEIADSLESLPDTPPQTTVQPENLSYMIYTSGSTGKAKGTMVRHSGLVNVYLAWERAYELRTRCRSHLQMASFSFDVFSGDWTRALCSGGKLVLVPRDMLLEADKLYAYLVREQVTIAEFVPAVLRNLIDYVEQQGKKLDNFRCLIAGSDIWYVSEYRNFKSYTGPDTRLINSFGLTEATIDSSWFETDDIDMPADRLVPIGRPFTNMTIHILDENFQPVPPGVRGELYVGGESLARGYYKRPDLTAERFIPNPFSRVAGARMYKTGDVARYLADGNIEFLGRADNQVKLRGFRIELGEIETALSDHAQIKDAVVILNEDTKGDKRLIAYFVSENSVLPASAELRNFLSEKLPEYMVPAAFINLESIPLTPNGKVDRRALPKPDQDVFMKDLEAQYVAPRSTTEEEVATIFSLILNVDKVGATHNFFLLGGHSLLATQLVSRLKSKFEIDLPLRAVFEDPTVAGLAQAVDLAMRQRGVAPAPPLVPVERTGELPLSFAQQRLWFLDRLEPNSPFYNIPENYRLQGPLDVDLLSQAISHIIERHESLRTTFHTKDGEPRLTIHEPFAVQVVQTDLSHLPKAEAEARAMEQIRTNAAQPIALDTLPLFRLELLRLSPNEHIISLVLHHIISDNWSTQVLMREMAIAYEALARKEDIPLPPLPIQYSDFAYWQRNWLQGAVLDEHLNYWKEELRDTPPLLELPYDRPRPAVQTFNGDYMTTELPESLSQQLKELGDAHGATLFMTLMAAFSALLHRYSGAQDINIGTPIANRNRPEVEGLIGFFVNTLVLHNRLHGNPSFMELLQRTRETALGAYAHQDLPFEKVVEAVDPQRNMSHTPLFQVMFALQSSQAAEQVQARQSRLSLAPLEAHSATAKFDLTLFVVEEAANLGLAMEYNTDLFDGQTIERMLNHFQLLLEGICKQPEQPIAQIPLLGPEETRLVQSDWNAKIKKPLFDQPIHQFFEMQAGRLADRPAVVYEDEVLSYSELNTEANRLAHYLLAKGVGAESTVGIAMARSPRMIISILAILKAGGAYVPLDIHYPPERLSYIMRDAGLNLVLTDSQSAKNLPEHTAEDILLDTRAEEISRSADTNPQTEIHAQQLVYMIYTSGSTGKPKGTLLTHRGLTHYLNWCLNTYPLETGRGSLVHSTLSFDATVTAVFTPMLTGKTITLVKEGADLDGLARALLHYRDFNIVKITPAHLELLAEQIPPQKAAGLCHAFIIGGENLTAGQIAFWQTNAPQTKLYNEYGPTETVVGCVVFEASGWRGRGSVPIGRAIHNTPVYILDSLLQPVPVGVPGELYIGGPAVARGYLHRPDLTAASFIPDPFSQIPGQRLYRTGDLVRYLADGQMVFLDRIDSQIKLRGYRIEPGEIETAIEAAGHINEAVVIVREDQPGDKRLVAYVVPEKSTDLDLNILRNHLKSGLPDYMIPAAFVVLEQMPLTANGKVDRKALPKPGMDALASGAEYVAPQSAEEKKMVALWQELLGVERVGMNDSFFDLGGHSLLVTQLVSRIRDLFGFELPLKDIFEAPTVATLLIKMSSAGTAKTVPPLVPATRPKHIPLSFAQQRLWFLDQLTPENPFYNIPAAMRVRGNLDGKRLQMALQLVCERHESLRTSFYEQDGTPFQKIAADLKADLIQYDYSGLSEKQRERKARQVVEKDAATPFQLNTAPLFRAILIKLAENEYIFSFNIHHIISDGWSTNVFIREMVGAYDALAQERTPGWQRLSVQYADFAIWQRGWLKEDVLQEQLEFWKQAIGINPAPLNLPTDFKRPAVQTFNGDTVKGGFPAELSSAITHAAQKQGVTLYMYLLAAFQAFLYRLARQEEILVGSPVAGRNLTETEGLIGFFVNTLVMHAEFEEHTSFSELLKQVKTNTLQAFAHQDIPFEQLVDQLQPERALSHSPLFQVMFVLQNRQQQQQPANGAAFELQALDTDSSVSKFDLTLMIVEDEPQLWAEFEFNTDLFRRETIESMLERFQYFLSLLNTQSAKSISSLALLPPAEAQKQIAEETYQHAELPQPALIHQWFEERVSLQPDESALVYGDQILTYQTLNKRANQLAHLIRSKGIQPEQFVGISLNRSPEMVIALLAVVKAGAVYVPIDPAYPQDRIAYILEDSGIALLLTQGTLVDHFNNLEIELIDLDSVPAENFATENPENRTHPRQLAYMIYTSGSTGRPKGTMLEHRSLCNLTRFQIKDFELHPQSQVLQFASFSFDASVSEIFTTLISGATLHLADRERMLPGPDLVNLMREKEISVVTLPPSVTALLEPDDFPALRTIISAGEACPPETARRWSAGRRMINAYGPTENTVCASSFVVPTDFEGTRVPIGKSIDNVRLYILDSGLNPLPPGIPGELYIAGISLARGYLNRADLTAERFIPDPFTNQPGQRMYRSGDLVLRNNEGFIEFVGRVDQQVKLRGFRIEPGEVEQVLAGHPQVQNAAVLVREDTPGNAYLAAYAVAKAGQASGEALKQYCAETLPDYMVPAVVMLLDEIPLTVNGKVDYKQLPKPDFQQLQATHLFIAPRSSEEQQLAEIFISLLNLEKVSINQSFFELGGHSLLATQLVSRIRQSFGTELPLLKVFESPTISGLLLAIEEARISTRRQSLPPLKAVDRNAALPLSFAQQRLWFLDQLAPDNASYNIPAALRLRGNFNLPAFRESLTRITKRHESLRTTFTVADGQPVQRIHEPDSFEARYVDLRQLPADTRLARATELAAEEAAEPFDLEVGPLFRVKLLQLDTEDHVILFNMHHIISDGWSVSVLIREFALLYDAAIQGREADLPALPIQYADYATWQRSWLKDEILQTQIDFWKQAIGLNPEPLQLFEDFPRPAIQTFNGAGYSADLPADLTAAIKSFCQQNGVTLFMFLATAFQTLLHRHSGQDRILVGSPIAGRTQMETENLIGFFVNNLVLKADFSQHSTFSEVLDSAKQHILQAYAHQDLPFEQLVEILQPERDMSRSPIFQSMFIMQNTPMEAVDLHDVQLEAIETEQKIAKYDLSLIMMENGDRLFAEFEFNTDLFRPSTIERMMTHFIHLLQAIVNQPHGAIRLLPLLGEQDRIRDLKSLIPGNVEFPDQHLIHQLFEEQAGKHPQQSALWANGRTYSYAQLNKRANRLARELIAEGVTSESIVVLCVERSAEMIVGMLAILKAGGAYLPVDPTYPQDRIRYIVEDAEAGFILTQETLRDKVDSSSAQVLLLDRLEEKCQKLPAGNPQPRCCPQNLAYVIYTSGSTGRPKGTMLTHYGLCNLTQALSKPYGVCKGSRNLQFASFSFDASVEEIFSALSNGSCLYIIDREVLLSGSGLVDFLQTHKITNATLPPALLSVFRPQDFPDLQNVISAGEACPVEVAQSWSEGRNLVNGYGPTENTVCTTAYRISGPLRGKSVPIGKPIDNVRVYILDSDLQPVASGLPGELYMTGPGLARGYLKRPDLTAERFLPDPFSEKPGQRMYRSGDLVRQLEDGNLEFLGRVDTQIKLRGYRIEPGEIEGVLVRQNGILDAVVQIIEDKLAAYLVTEPGTDVQLHEIQEHASQLLPEYMVPAAWQILEQIPLTPNGKVDYRALPKPEFDSQTATTEFLEPRSTLEVRLRDIWREVLGRQKIGVLDNFFEMGGHSLLAMRLLTAVEQRLGKDVNLVNFFRQPTIEHLAKIIENEADFESGASLVQLRKGDTSKAVYFVHPSGGAVHHYAELAGLLDTDRSVFGIQAQGLDGKMELHKTIEDMAAAYIQNIKEIQPEGPYYLSSWSLGSIIVHEMARQLEATGNTIGCLIQLDQTPYISYQRPKDTAEMLAEMFKRYFKVDQEYLRSLPEIDQFKVVIKKAKKHKAIPRFVRLADFKRYILVNETQIQAWLDYKVKPIQGKMTLIRSEENAQADPGHLGWQDLCDQVDIVDVPGNHIKMLQQPYVKDVARVISRLLKDADEN